MDSRRWIVPFADGCDPAACWCYDRNPGTTFWAQDTIYIRDEAGRVLAEFDRDVDQANTYTYTWARNNYPLFGRMAAADVNTNYGTGAPIASRRYYFHDHLGSERAVIDAQDTYLNNMEYWPYGENMNSETNNEDWYRYTGHERDYDLNLDYQHARHYDYSRGRFLSPDPVNTGNLYTYVGNNPLNFTDPWGLAAVGPPSEPDDPQAPPDWCTNTAGCRRDGTHCLCVDENGNEVEAHDAAEAKSISQKREFTEKKWIELYYAYLYLSGQFNPSDEYFESHPGFAAAVMWLREGTSGNIEPAGTLEYTLAALATGGLSLTASLSGAGREPVHIGLDFAKSNLAHFGIHNKWGAHIGLLFNRQGHALIHVYKSRIYIKW